MQVQNKLTLAYDYIGEQEVKNIAKPVPVYKVQLEADGTIAPAASTVSQKRPAPRPVEETGPSRRWPLAALAVVAVLLVAGGVLLFNPVSQQPTSPGDLDAPEETPALPLPDKPSLAVLPFTNLSGDPAQEYFSDGMTETLITDLSKLASLFIISRKAVFDEVVIANDGIALRQHRIRVAFKAQLAELDPGEPSASQDKCNDQPPKTDDAAKKGFHAR